jgi:hypothetical protein
MSKYLILILLGLPFFSNAQKKKWQNMFDGKSTAGWHTWKSHEVKGWHVMGGTLMTHGGNGDLVSDKEYGDFVLEFEFNVMPKGNSGLIYKVIENPADASLVSTYTSGPEFQIIDDKNYPQKLKDTQKTGANYDIYPPKDYMAAKPAGTWNKAKLIVKNNHIQHILNGIIVADYEYGTAQWQADVAKSKFAGWAYATAHAKGKIALQDHGDSASFRKIRIKEY